MCHTVKGHEKCILPPFYDDVIAKGKGFADSYNKLKTVFQDIRKSGLTLNLLKCAFFLKEIRYLGHIIGGGEIKIDPDKIQVITSFPTPNNKTDLKRFIGKKIASFKGTNCASVRFADITLLLAPADFLECVCPWL